MLLSVGAMGKKRLTKKSVSSARGERRGRASLIVASTNPPPNNSTRTTALQDITIRSFQQWVRGLNWKDLQDILNVRVDGNQDQQSSSSQSELDLLREMVRLQPALPTPSHPRAIPFSPASARGKSYFDHRSATEDLKVRMDRPRMFQWISRESAMLSSGSMNDAEAELLAMLTGGSPPSKPAGRNKKSKGKLGGRKNPLNMTYDVVARRFRQVDGELLGNYGSEASRQADGILLQSTVVYSADDQCWCRFEFRVKDITDPARVIDILRKASRGNFATVAMDVNDSSGLAPWFDPEDRWFHLSTFLASRFEGALWKAFHHQNESISPLPALPTFDHLSEHDLNALYAVAVAKSVEDALGEDRSKLLHPFHIRDGAIWSALVENDFQLLTCGISESSIRRRVEDLWFSPVVELGSVSEQWRRRLFGHFRALHAAHMESILLDEGGVSDDTSRTNNVSRASKRKKSNHPGRRVEKFLSKEDGREKQNENEGGDEDTIASSSSEFSDEETTLQIVADSQKDLQSQQQPSRKKRVNFRPRVSANERNRNTVLVLSIVEEIIGSVFQTVGLVDPDSTPGAENSREEPFRLIGSEGKASDKPFVNRLKALPPKPRADPKPKKSQQPFRKEGQRRSPSKDTVEQRTAGASYLSPREKQKGSLKFNTYASVANASSHDEDAAAEWSNENSFFPTVQQIYGSSEDPSATIRTSNLEGLQYGNLSTGFFSPPDAYTFGSTGWGGQVNSIFDDWGRFRGFDGRNESILAEFFHSQEEAQQNRDEMVMASSTAASVASSFDKEHEAVISSLDDVDILSVEERVPDFCPQQIIDEAGELSQRSRAASFEVERVEPDKPPSPHSDPDENNLDHTGTSLVSPPATPSPTLSPILVSLSDLSELRKESLDGLQIPSSRSLSSEPGTSLPPSPREPPQRSKTNSLSRDAFRTTFSTEDVDGRHGFKIFPHPVDASKQTKLAATSSCMTSRDDHDVKTKSSVRRSADALSSYRIRSFKPGISRDDHDINPRAKETPQRFSSYRNAAIRATQSSPLKSSFREPTAQGSFGHFHFETISTRKEVDGDMCTQSETALDVHEDFHSLNESRRSRPDEVDNATTKDGSTTITSGASQREPEDMILLREERNTYRDMCLTLGAEVAKLKALLAAQHQHPSPQVLTGGPGDNGFNGFHGTGPFDPKTVTPTFNIAPRARTLAAMSDAGYRGEHESLASEDEIAVKVFADSSRQLSSGLTVAESDVSLDPTSGHQVISMPLGFQARESQDPLSMNGMQSRLARDIFQFIETTNAQLRKQDSRKQAAMERITRLVCAAWPRAQVKVYGSHVTGLCVPSSDLDIVVCLPAVHKNDVADAAGALEGRNAIRETSQKQLARRLKGESWIDPRSMKVIDRTVVPVIKVATKDTKAKTLNLDISFDAPGHHGIEAVHMVKSIMEELPMLRPLVVVLKQFLIDRSLLEAYTGTCTVISPLNCSPDYGAPLCTHTLSLSYRWIKLVLSISNGCPISPRARICRGRGLATNGLSRFLRQSREYLSIFYAKCLKYLGSNFAHQYTYVFLLDSLILARQGFLFAIACSSLDLAIKADHRCGLGLFRWRRPLPQEQLLEM